MHLLCYANKSLKLKPICNGEKTKVKRIGVARILRGCAKPIYFKLQVFQKLIDGNISYNFAHVS